MNYATTQQNVSPSFDSDQWTKIRPPTPERTDYNNSDLNRSPRPTIGYHISPALSSEQAVPLIKKPVHRSTPPAFDDLGTNDRRSEGLYFMCPPPLEKTDHSNNDGLRPPLFHDSEHTGLNTSSNFKQRVRSPPKLFSEDRYTSPSREYPLSGFRDDVSSFLQVRPTVSVLDHSHIRKYNDGSFDHRSTEISLIPLTERSGALEAFDSNRQRNRAHLMPPPSVLLFSPSQLDGTRSWEGTQPCTSSQPVDNAMTFDTDQHDSTHIMNAEKPARPRRRGVLPPPPPPARSLSPVNKEEEQEFIVPLATFDVRTHLGVHYSPSNEVSNTTTRVGGHSETVSETTFPVVVYVATNTVHSANAHDRSISEHSIPVSDHNSVIQRSFSATDLALRKAYLTKMPPPPPPGDVDEDAVERESELNLNEPAVLTFTEHRSSNDASGSAVATVTLNIRQTSDVGECMGERETENSDRCAPLESKLSQRASQTLDYSATSFSRIDLAPPSLLNEYQHSAKLTTLKSSFSSSSNDVYYFVEGGTGPIHWNDGKVSAEEGMQRGGRSFGESDNEHEGATMTLDQNEKEGKEESENLSSDFVCVKVDSMSKNLLDFEDHTISEYHPRDSPFQSLPNAPQVSPAEVRLLDVPSVFESNVIHDSVIEMTSDESSSSNSNSPSPETRARRELESNVHDEQREGNVNVSSSPSQPAAEILPEPDTTADPTQMMRSSPLREDVLEDSSRARPTRLLADLTSASASPLKSVSGLPASGLPASKDTVASTSREKEKDEQQFVKSTRVPDLSGQAHASLTGEQAQESLVESAFSTDDDEEEFMRIREAGRFISNVEAERTTFGKISDVSITKIGHFSPASGSRGRRPIPVSSVKTTIATNKRTQQETRIAKNNGEAKPTSVVERVSDLISVATSQSPSSAVKCVTPYNSASHRTSRSSSVASESEMRHGALNSANTRKHNSQLGETVGMNSRKVKKLVMETTLALEEGSTNVKQRINETKINAAVERILEDAQRQYEEARSKKTYHHHQHNLSAASSSRFGKQQDFSISSRDQSKTKSNTPSTVALKSRLEKNYYKLLRGEKSKNDLSEARRTSFKGGEHEKTSDDIHHAYLHKADASAVGDISPISKPSSYSADPSAAAINATLISSTSLFLPHDPLHTRSSDQTLYDNQQAPLGSYFIEIPHDEFELDQQLHKIKTQRVRDLVAARSPSKTIDSPKKSDAGSIGKPPTTPRKTSPAHREVAARSPSPTVFAITSDFSPVSRYNDNETVAGSYPHEDQTSDREISLSETPATAQRGLSQLLTLDDHNHERKYDNDAMLANDRDQASSASNSLRRHINEAEINMPVELNDLVIDTSLSIGTPISKDNNNNNNNTRNNNLLGSAPNTHTFSSLPPISGAPLSSSPPRSNRSSGGGLGGGNHNHINTAPMTFSNLPQQLPALTNERAQVDSTSSSAAPSSTTGNNMLLNSVINAIAQAFPSATPSLNYQQSPNPSVGSNMPQPSQPPAGAISANPPPSLLNTLMRFGETTRDIQSPLVNLQPSVTPSSNGTIQSSNTAPVVANRGEEIQSNNLITTDTAGKIGYSSTGLSLIKEVSYHPRRSRNQQFASTGINMLSTSNAASSSKERVQHNTAGASFQRAEAKTVDALPVSSPLKKPITDDSRVASPKTDDVCFVGTGGDNGAHAREPGHQKNDKEFTIAGSCVDIEAVENLPATAPEKCTSKATSTIAITSPSQEEIPPSPPPDRQELGERETTRESSLQSEGQSHETSVDRLSANVKSEMRTSPSPNSSQSSLHGTADLHHVEIEIASTMEPHNGESGAAHDFETKNSFSHHVLTHESPENDVMLEFNENQALVKENEAPSVSSEHQNLTVVSQLTAPDRAGSGVGAPTGSNLGAGSRAGNSRMISLNNTGAFEILSAASINPNNSLNGRQSTVVSALGAGACTPLRSTPLQVGANRNTASELPTPSSSTNKSESSSANEVRPQLEFAISDGKRKTANRADDPAQNSQAPKTSSNRVQTENPIPPFPHQGQKKIIIVRRIKPGTRSPPRISVPSLRTSQPQAPAQSTSRTASNTPSHPSRPLRKIVLIPKHLQQTPNSRCDAAKVEIKFGSEIIKRRPREPTEENANSEPQYSRSDPRSGAQLQQIPLLTVTDAGGAMVVGSVGSSQNASSSPSRARACEGQNITLKESKNPPCASDVIIKPLGTVVLTNDESGRDDDESCILDPHILYSANSAITSAALALSPIQFADSFIANDENVPHMINTMVIGKDGQAHPAYLHSMPQFRSQERDTMYCQPRGPLFLTPPKEGGVYVVSPGTKRDKGISSGLGDPHARPSTYPNFAVITSEDVTPRPIGQHRALDPPPLGAGRQRITVVDHNHAQTQDIKDVLVPTSTNQEVDRFKRFKFPPTASDEDEDARSTTRSHSHLSQSTYGSGTVGRGTRYIRPPTVNGEDDVDRLIKAGALGLVDESGALRDPARLVIDPATGAPRIREYFPHPLGPDDLTPLELAATKMSHNRVTSPEKSWSQNELHEAPDSKRPPMPRAPSIETCSSSSIQSLEESSSMGEHEIEETPIPLIWHSSSCGMVPTGSKLDHDGCLVPSETHGILVSVAGGSIAYTSTKITPLKEQPR